MQPRAQSETIGTGLTRRRALRIMGAAAGLPLLAPPAVWARPGAGEGAADRAGAGGAMARGVLYHEGGLSHWQGAALGADAGITLHHADPALARRIIAACLAEVERLERIFSLYREDSELVRLTRMGRLEAPSHDMVRLLATSLRFGALSGGAFDVTVQPLWRLYADHFARDPDDREGPDPKAVAAARALVDYRRLRVGPERITLGADGMAVTLNGIAQGYITDRVAELLRRAGIRDVLIQLGETRALGHRPDGGPWRIGIADPQAPERIARRLTLANRALATSGGYGAPFDRLGRFHHLFDPLTGRSAGHTLAVSVVAAEATVADALSTALSAAPPDRAPRLVKAVGGVTAFLTLADGRTVTLRG